jgi:predicted nucleic acid-binding protein
LLKLLGRDKFEVCISVPLVLEYESTTKRISRTLGLRHQDIDDIIDYICAVSEHRQIHFLWRPFLRDPSDDMVLELAVESESDYIITHNISDFAGIRQLGVEALRPGEFLRKIGEL